MRPMEAFDIETGPADPTTVELFRPRFDRLDDRDKWESRLGLSALTGMVYAIGYTNGEETYIQHAADGTTEQAMLEEFWRKYRENRTRRVTMAGHNVLGFDLPFIIRRSWFHGIDVPKTVRNWEGKTDELFMDTMLLWQLWTSDKWVSLNDLAKLFGFGAKFGKAADFATLLVGTPAERDQALAYLETDLRLTYQVAERVRFNYS